MKEESKEKEKPSGIYPDSLEKSIAMDFPFVKAVESYCDQEGDLDVLTSHPKDKENNEDQGDGVKQKKSIRAAKNPVESYIMITCLGKLCFEFICF